MRILQKYSGVVEKGIQLGRKLGFPTANIYPSKPLPIKYGVYVVYVTYKNIQYLGVANYGMKLSPIHNNEAIEVYIFNFDSNIYGEHITVDFIKYIRDVMKFETIDDLKQQIGKDVEYAKEMLKNME